MRGFEIEGFLAVPPSGSALKRLDHDRHDFIALTNVLLSGAEGAEALPFLAVNRRFVTTAQVAEDVGAAAAVSDSRPVS
jgi:hypothetical protein